MQRNMMVTILTRNKKKKIAQCLAECIPGFKDPYENDESNEKNNFNEDNKKLLSVIAFTKHKHYIIHEAGAKLQRPTKMTKTTKVLNDFDENYKKNR